MRPGRRLAALLCALVAGYSAPAGARPRCELDRPVMFGDLDWDSNRFHTALARIIVETGFGCRTDAIPGSTIPLMVAIGRGDIDILMEVWKDNVTEAWERAEREGKAVLLGVNYPDSVQGWFVPRYLIEGDPGRGIAPRAPGLRRVRDLPRFKHLFRDPEEPSKGRFYNCVLGWNCEIINTRKLAAYGLDRDFTNFRAGTGAALAAAIASRYARGRPFLAYYWSPTWVLAKYDLVMLAEEPYNERDWLALRNTDDPRKAKPVAYPSVAVHVGANTEFARAAPGLVRFLSKYGMSARIVSQALLYLKDTPDADAGEAAREFLRTREDVWRGWLSTDAAARVSAALR